MAYTPVLDSVSGVIIATLLMLGVTSFAMATFVEAIVLWHEGWGSFLHTLLTSFAMNLASTLVGYLLAIISGLGLTAETFILLFVLSVGIEGGIMLGMRADRYKAIRVWQIALVANVISYILMAIGLGLFLLGF